MPRAIRLARLRTWQMLLQITKMTRLELIKWERLPFGKQAMTMKFSLGRKSQRLQANWPVDKP